MKRKYGNCNGFPFRLKKERRREERELDERHGDHAGHGSVKPERRREYKPRSKG